MKGAKADPSVRTINAPKSKRIIIIGVNHHFFLTFINSQNSLIMLSLLTLSPLCKLKLLSVLLIRPTVPLYQDEKNKFYPSLMLLE